MVILWNSKQPPNKKLNFALESTFIMLSLISKTLSLLYKGISHIRAMARDGNRHVYGLNFGLLYTKFWIRKMRFSFLIWNLVYDRPKFSPRTYPLPSLAMARPPPASWSLSARSFFFTNISPQWLYHFIYKSTTYYFFPLKRTIFWYFSYKEHYFFFPWKTKLVNMMNKFMSYIKFGIKKIRIKLQYSSFCEMKTYISIPLRVIKNYMKVND